MPAIAVMSLLPHGSLLFDKVTDLQASPKKQTQSTLNISFGICFSWTLKLERMCLFFLFFLHAEGLEEESRQKKMHIPLVHLPKDLPH